MAEFEGSHLSFVDVNRTSRLGMGDPQPNQPVKTKSDHVMCSSKSTSAMRSSGTCFRIEPPRQAVSEPSATR